MRGPGGLSLEVRRLRSLIRCFFADYLRIVESDAAGELRLDDIALRRKPVDGVAVVAEIASRRGEKVTALVRVEPEGLSQTETSLRLGESVRSLRLPYGEPVLAGRGCASNQQLLRRPPGSICDECERPRSRGSAATGR